MIKCHLSRILGERKQKIAEVSRETGINRNTLHRLYNETATRVELDVIETLCRYLDIQIGELFEIEEGDTQEKVEQ
ncbi:helix-turn-helix domain-containing protein [Oceanisphaera pacifica]|uniref:Helix-turn-helix transcriptional regulator n=1 Tax=Oceanisphaera pacifica TaxID=2818389 RepID=A0ABS3NJD1_9GAMM|nr:helix-turn-helix transcriptional regulator [Oceanisphaera pacifica]MBO1520701.1 helix-turn-helix transcriptional regulator [Oceanisphaera pacifica]